MPTKEQIEQIEKDFESAVEYVQFMDEVETE